MNARGALRLQLEWGADEALLPAPAKRMRAAALPAMAAPAEAAPAEAAPVEATPAGLTSRRAVPAGGVGDARAARALAWGAGSVAALREAIRGFDPDGLAATATALVFPAETTPAPVAVVGDVPGAEEDRAGAPFSGPNRALLEAMLASIGLRLPDVACAHALPWRPPGGREASEAELAAYLPFLHRLFALRGCRWLLLLGTAPTRALLGRALPPSRLRGSWRAVTLDADEGAPVPAPAPVQALATHGLAQVMQRPELKAVVWRDLRLLRRTLDGR